MTLDELNNNYFDFCFNCFSLGAQTSKFFSEKSKLQYEQDWQDYFKYWQSLDQSKINFFSVTDDDFFEFRLPLKIKTKEDWQHAPSGACYTLNGMKHLLENHIPGKIIHIEESSYFGSDPVYLVTGFRIE